MRVLVACEESGRVRDAFRALGHDAWSVDILETRADPRWHIQAPVEEVLAQDAAWDLMVAFPPCTDLAVSGARHWPAKVADGRQGRAISFFRMLADFPIPRVALENPVGIMSRVWRKPDQIIQPFHFGDPWRKTTCLWLRNLPPLRATDVVEHHGRMEGWHGDYRNLQRREERQRLRSQTYPGIARAMAAQWGALGPVSIPRQRDATTLATR